VIHFIRFNVIGVLGFVLQAMALFVLTHNPFRIGYLFATAAAVELAILHNFIWHQCWTWKDRPSVTTAETVRRLVRFNVTNGAVSLVGNVTLMSFLVGGLRLPVLAANLVSVVGCSICNFFLADRIAFYMESVEATMLIAPLPVMAQSPEASSPQASTLK